jgi:hypothetical protein
LNPKPSKLSAIITCFDTSTASSHALEEFYPGRHLGLIAARIKTTFVVLPSQESSHNEKWRLGLAT